MYQGGSVGSAKGRSGLKSINSSSLVYLTTQIWTTKPIHGRVKQDEKERSTGATPLDLSGSLGSTTTRCSVAEDDILCCH